MAKKDLPRVAILGAGPIGLEAALQARALGWPFTVYERARVAEYMQRWGHVRLFSPFAMNVTPLGLTTIKGSKPNHPFPAEDACITGREHVAVYLAPLAEILQANVQLETQVLMVGRPGFLKHEGPGDPRRGRVPFRLLLRDKKGERYEEADVVLDCTGTYGQHRWLGDGGIPALGELTAEGNIAYWLEDILGEKKNVYANKNVMVVGAGYSAATTVCNLAQLGLEASATWGIWICRGEGSQPMKRIPGDPLKERDRLAARANNLATRTDDNVEFHAQTVVDAVEFFGPDKGFKVTTRCAGKVRIWEVDRLIANLGYSPDRNPYRELQIHECYASGGPMKLASTLEVHKGQDCLKQKGQGAETLKNPEANYYILGAKSYGRNTSFLLRVGFEQVREVFQFIGQK
jgi:hypothetical protein